MKQIGFRQPHYRQFSLDEDDKPGRFASRAPRAASKPAPERRTPRVTAFRPGSFGCRRRERVARAAQPVLMPVRRSVGRRLQRAMSRGLDRYGYYVAVGICALMVFTGALAGVMGHDGLNATPTPAPSALATELTGDVNAAQASAGGMPDDAEEGEAAPAHLALWPLEGELLTGHATDNLVYQPTLGLYATHPGIDIACARGQVAVACADGEIVRCWRESLMGNVVELRTEDGVVARYANLMSLDLVREGETVRAGDAIGAVGASAMSESLLPTHLHFEVLVEGESVPPLDWLPAAQAE